MKGYSVDELDRDMIRAKQGIEKLIYDSMKAHVGLEPSTEAILAHFRNDNIIT